MVVTTVSANIQTVLAGTPPTSVASGPVSCVLKAAASTEARTMPASFARQYRYRTSAALSLLTVTSPSAVRAQSNNPFQRQRTTRRASRPSGARLNASDTDMLFTIKLDDLVGLSHIIHMHADDNSYLPKCNPTRASCTAVCQPCLASA